MQLSPQALLFPGVQCLQHVFGGGFVAGKNTVGTGDGATTTGIGVKVTGRRVGTTLRLATVGVAPAINSIDQPPVARMSSAKALVPVGIVSFDPSGTRRPSDSTTSIRISFTDETEICSGKSPITFSVSLSRPVTLPGVEIDRCTFSVGVDVMIVGRGVYVAVTVRVAVEVAVAVGLSVTSAISMVAVAVATAISIGADFFGSSRVGSMVGTAAGEPQLMSSDAMKPMTMMFFMLFSAAPAN